MKGFLFLSFFGLLGVLLGLPPPLLPVSQLQRPPLLPVFVPGAEIERDECEKRWIPHLCPTLGLTNGKRVWETIQDPVKTWEERRSETDGKKWEAHELYMGLYRETDRDST